MAIKHSSNHHHVAVCTTQEYGGTLKVVKVEADPNPKLVEQYQVWATQRVGLILPTLLCPSYAPLPPPLPPHTQVYGLPTLLIVKDGAVVEGSKHEGAIGKDKLFQYLEKHGLVKVNA